MRSNTRELIWKGFFLSVVYCAFNAAKTNHPIYIELSGISKYIYKAVFALDAAKKHNKSM